MWKLQDILPNSWSSNPSMQLYGVDPTNNCGAACMPATPALTSAGYSGGLTSLKQSRRTLYTLIIPNIPGGRCSRTDGTW